MIFNIEMAYQMECCGDLPTRHGKIERFINELVNSSDPNDVEVQYFLARECGLDLDDLTFEEIDYILKEVSNRR
jgi:hypothetical protein